MSPNSVFVIDAFWNDLRVMAIKTTIPIVQIAFNKDISCCSFFSSLYIPFFMFCVFLENDDNSS